ncbi:PatA/PatG family cyanobactin maturation protease [Aliikangiella sp. IMCC44359]|uniref:PatA/PatG family cyanobactin maturation protease n=1 Tax=Aliikangiella sp. IMCC44359 TaxID=3459125 RepID=UPI00403B1E50
MNSIESLPGLKKLWAETKGSTEICIAVLDGPVDKSHICFNTAQLKQIDFMALGNAGIDPASQHGTHVASIIFGQHNTNVKGVAPGCRGISIPIYSSKNGGSLSCLQLDLARAINQAIDQGAHIINISGGELSASGVADPILEKAIRRCHENNILLIAAAGNDGCRCLHVPASVSSVLAVGAMGHDGTALDFSNWGEIYQKQGILALGENILGAVSATREKVIQKSGTSFATPIVSGVAALLLSLQLEYKQEFDPLKIRQILLESADACGPLINIKPDTNCEKMLAGRLNISTACKLLRASVDKDDINNKAKYTKVESASLKRVEVVPQDLIQSNLASNSSIQTNLFTKTNQSEKRSYVMSENPYIPQEATDAAEINDVVSNEADTNNSGVQAAELTSSQDTEIELPVSTTSTIEASEVTASDCSCQQGEAAPGIAYVLGQLGYDFGTESKRDSFLQLAGTDVHNPSELLKYLKNDPASAANIYWTLSLDATVVYAIQPYGPFAANVYTRLQEFLDEQINQGVERVSIPGYVKGSVRLLNGQQVPILYPDLRGMYSWSTEHLIKAICGESPKEAKALALHAKKVDGVQNFLERVYYEVRNLGVSPQERAMNYAATNAFQIEDVYNKAIENDMKLDSIEVERSPICRPGSDCWDVKLGFFNPSKRHEQARHVHRFTIDVSEVIPVTVGKPRHWDVY